MPQIQIIGQEKLAARMGARDREVQREQMQQTAMQKAMEFRQMGEELKIKSKAVEAESEKNRILSLANRMDYLAKTYDTAAKYDQPELVIGQMLKISGDNTIQAMTDPLVREMTGKLSPVGSRYKNALAGIIENKYSGKQGGPVNPAMDGGTAGSGNSVMSGGPNMPQANMVGGGMPGATQQPWGSDEPILTNMNEGGATVNFPSELYRNKMIETMASQAGQPLSENTANAVAFEEVATPVFEELYKKIENLKGNMGVFGGAKMNAGTEKGPGQSILRMIESPQQREIANLLNRVKQIAFTYGGKTLSPTEQQRVDAVMNPVNQTTDQWINGLKWMYKRLSRAATLQVNPKGNMNLGSGRPQQTSTQSSTPKRSKMIGGYMVSY